MPVNGMVNDRDMTLQITGEIDHHQAKRLMNEIERRIDFSLPKKLTLDLSGVTFMDSSGIAVVLRAWRRMNELEGELEICQVPPQAGKVLRTAGLEKLLHFHTTI